MNTKYIYHKFEKSLRIEVKLSLLSTIYTIINLTVCNTIFFYCEVFNSNNQLYYNSPAFISF